MFYKELACFILFSYQCSLVSLISYLCQRLLHYISCFLLCQQLFSTFFDLFFSSFEEGFKLHLFKFLLLACSATLPTIHLGSRKVNNIFSKKSKRAKLPKPLPFSSHFYSFLSIAIILSRIPRHCYNFLLHKYHLSIP